MSIRESLKSLVEHQLNPARDASGQYAQKNLKEDDNVKQMVVAGSKGSFINISQMSVLRGLRENEWVSGFLCVWYIFFFSVSSSVIANEIDLTHHFISYG